MARRTLLAVAVLALAGCVAAATKHVSAPAAPPMPHLPTKADRGEPRCPPHARTTVDFGACIGKELLGLDAQFDTAVAAFWPKLDATGKADFSRGQRSWSRYEHAECDAYEREYLGGTEMGIEHAACDVALTRARVVDIKGMLALYSQGV